MRLDAINSAHKNINVINAYFIINIIYYKNLLFFLSEGKLFLSYMESKNLKKYI